MPKALDFYDNFFQLLNETTDDFSSDEKLDFIEKVVKEKKRLDSKNNTITCEFIPFVRGRRPLNESVFPGLGSSDNICFITSENVKNNQAYILYKLTGLESWSDRIDEFQLELSLTFCGYKGKQLISKKIVRDIQPQVFSNKKHSKDELVAISLAETEGKTLVIKLSPSTDLNHAEIEWLYNFETFFSQRILIELRINHLEVPLDYTHIFLETFDTRKLNSLYGRIVDKVIKNDVEKQSKKLNKDDLDYKFHPLYPIFSLCSKMSNLYIESIVYQVFKNCHQLTDVLWLMRVYVYLEFISVLGFAEAVKDEYGDLLSHKEREALEEYSEFKQIKNRLNVNNWKEIWKHRHIIISKQGVPKLGEVSSQNIQEKRNVMLLFLNTYKHDLYNAIEIAGANTTNAQESFKCIFQNLEMILLNNMFETIPELNFINDQSNKFILLNDKNHLTKSSRNWILKMFGQQDGLLIEISSKYRDILNDVAQWVKKKQLIDYIGNSCIPQEASLIHWIVNHKLDQLDRMNELNQIEALSTSFFTTDERRKSSIFKEKSFFKILTNEECEFLANISREIMLRAKERIMIEGEPGSSLFIVGKGSLEVLMRNKDGSDLIINTLHEGDIIGEISLLTGESRSATVRSVNNSVVYEIGQKQYEPILHARPELVDSLAVIMLERTIQTKNKKLTQNEKKQEKETLKNRIWNFFFQGSNPF